MSIQSVISVNSLTQNSNNTNTNTKDEYLKNEETKFITKMENLILVNFILNCIKILETLILGILYAIILSFSDIVNNELKSFVIISCIINFIVFAYGLCYTIYNFSNIYLTLNGTNSNNNEENKNKILYMHIGLLIWSATLLYRLNNDEISNYVYSVVIIEIVHNAMWLSIGGSIILYTVCIMSKTINKINKIYKNENKVHVEKNIDNV